MAVALVLAQDAGLVLPLARQIQPKKQARASRPSVQSQGAVICLEFLFFDSAGILAFLFL